MNTNNHNNNMLTQAPAPPQHVAPPLAPLAPSPPLPAWMSPVGAPLIRCSHCHLFKQDEAYRVRAKRGNKWSKRHICPASHINGCPGFETCHYERGHRAEISALRRKRREKEQVRKDILRQQAKKEREAVALKKKENKKKAAEEKEAQKQKHLFSKCRKLSTYLDMFGLDER